MRENADQNNSEYEQFLCGVPLDISWRKFEENVSNTAIVSNLF